MENVKLDPFVNSTFRHHCVEYLTDRSQNKVHNSISHRRLGWNY